MPVMKEGHIYLGKHKIGAVFFGGYIQGDDSKEENWVTNEIYVSLDDLGKQDLIHISKLNLQRGAKPK